GPGVRVDSCVVAPGRPPRRPVSAPTTDDRRSIDRIPKELRTEMAGHSHSANIAHRKGLVDAKRGKLFSKLCRAIYVAARNGDPNPDSNLRLRYALDKGQ